MSIIQEFFNKNKGSTPWNNYDFDKPSLAVVAINEKEAGAVLYTVGGHIRMEMEEAGLSHLDDLGLYPPKPGIWIWEGITIWYPGSYEYPTDGEMEFSGKWRLPTNEEWEKIKEGKCPWNDNEWKLSDDEEKKLCLQ